MFEKVLQSFIEAQAPGALNNFQLTLGTHVKTVNLKIPLAFIIGDAQGGDTICGRSAYYQQNARRISRMCNATPTHYENNAPTCCKLLRMKSIQQMVLKEKEQRLHNLMQYNHWMAFFDVDYGGSPGGVFTAACSPQVITCIGKWHYFTLLKRSVFNYFISFITC